MEKGGYIGKQVSRAEDAVRGMIEIGGYRMVQNRAFSAYTNSKVLTATPAELTLMLYDGAIKFTNIAIVGIEHNDIEKAHNNISKVEKILLELDTTLNDQYEISKDFHNVYHYLLHRTHEANAKKDKEILEEVSKHLHTMRDTWKEVMQNSAGSDKTQVS
jgi:flagellar protein FliS